MLASDLVSLPDLGSQLNRFLTNSAECLFQTTEPYKLEHFPSMQAALEKVVLVNCWEQAISASNECIQYLLGENCRNFCSYFQPERNVYHQLCLLRAHFSALGMETIGRTAPSTHSAAVLIHLIMRYKIYESRSLDENTRNNYIQILERFFGGNGPLNGYKATARVVAYRTGALKFKNKAFAPKYSNVETGKPNIALRKMGSRIKNVFLDSDWEELDLENGMDQLIEISTYRNESNEFNLELALFRLGFTRPGWINLNSRQNEIIYGSSPYSTQPPSSSSLGGRVMFTRVAR